MQLRVIIALLAVLPLSAGYATARAASGTSVLVAGIPGAIYGGDAPTCGAFVLSANPIVVRDVAVSATGIDATFSTKPADRASNCPTAGAPIARLPSVTSAGTTVYYRISPAAFPPEGDTINGAVHVGTSDATPSSVDVPIVLRHVSSLSHWFVATVVPPLLTAAIGVLSAVIGLLFYQKQKRIDQHLAADSAFIEYRGLNRIDLNRFFTGVYLNACDAYNGTHSASAAASWRTTITKELMDRQIWERIPPHERLLLLRELSADDFREPEEIAIHLARLFPEFANQISPLRGLILPRRALGGEP